ncbi:hypothetical protein GCM10025865_24060 [Paraoerskovia sediminicola]|uniref:ATP synthase F0 subunit B n=1 Tax=Paraoerskovia sediminicola TaxID=1138587 RepID=A0ABN6XE12_9CELL|nr:hypothetical protein [Paraoerskovia sediminicola]BDZ43107.1 hypothetical protein GCM10025865_24060 [Paraoerskovia sediminicola]
MTDGAGTSGTSGPSGQGGAVGPTGGAPGADTQPETPLVDAVAESGAIVPGLMDDLARLLDTARPMPMSSSVLVHRPEAQALVEKLRAELTEQLAHADAVLASAEATIEEAERKADELVAAARARAFALVQRESVVVQAQERADEIVRAADDDARRRRAEADDYCDQRLSGFEIDLGKMLAQVHAGRARLAEPREAPGGA